MGIKIESGVKIDSVEIAVGVKIDNSLKIDSGGKIIAVGWNMESGMKVPGGKAKRQPQKIE